ncbi:hypothetical protein AC249_AIPGENE2245 [Exaiptasia diaphana]|nr:hypothetical protein AC249_AIPGENE2245 [Exaiptasia diaphana]
MLPGFEANTEQTRTQNWSILQNVTDKEPETKPTQSTNSKPRQLISNYQKRLLLASFEKSKYIGKLECQILAEKTGLSTKTIRIWFRNKRFRTRQPARHITQYQHSFFWQQHPSYAYPIPEDFFCPPRRMQDWESFATTSAVSVGRALDQNPESLPIPPWYYLDEGRYSVSRNCLPDNLNQGLLHQ